MTTHFGTNQFFPLLIYDHNMSFFISYPLSALVHLSYVEPALGLISCPMADKGYDMKNAM